MPANSKLEYDVYKFGHEIEQQLSPVRIDDARQDSSVHAPLQHVSVLLGYLHTY